MFSQDYDVFMIELSCDAKGNINLWNINAGNLFAITNSEGFYDPSNFFIHFILFLYKNMFTYSIILKYLKKTNPMKLLK